VLDARPVIETIPGQEILSEDGVTLKVSLLLEFHVVDPKRAIRTSASFRDALYARAQVALRAAVGERTIEKVLASRADLGESLTREIAPAAEELGIKLVSIFVKDIMFPGPLKEAFSQAARARQEALAALERARGEHAALRSLSNTARMLHNNPQLFQLRLLQTAAEGGQVVVNISTPPGASVAETSDDNEG